MPARAYRQRARGWPTGNEARHQYCLNKSKSRMVISQWRSSMRVSSEIEPARDDGADLQLFPESVGPKSPPASLIAPGNADRMRRVNTTAIMAKAAPDAFSAMRAVAARGVRLARAKSAQQISCHQNNIVAR